MGKAARKMGPTDDPEVLAKIRADLERWRPGLWAEENAYGPACVCGAGERTLMAARALGSGDPTGECYRHPGGMMVRASETAEAQKETLGPPGS